MTRRENLIAAFHAAGSGGLSRKQIKQHAGPRGMRVFGDLCRDGWVFRSSRSKYGNRAPWRWELVLAPAARDHTDLPGEPAPEPLFTPQPRPAASAVFGEPDHDFPGCRF